MCARMVLAPTRSQPVNHLKNQTFLPPNPAWHGSWFALAVNAVARAYGMTAGREKRERVMEASGRAADVFFVLMGAILMFAMHAGFAFLEVGTIRSTSRRRDVDL